MGGGWSTGRWVGLVASPVFIASAVLAAPPAAVAADCPDAEVIFARGTDEPVGMGRVGDALVDSLRSQVPGLNIESYPVNYKAGKLQLHGGDGANDVISHIKSTVSSCPTTRIVLGGYSQGASVIDIVAGVPMAGITWGSSLPPEYADNIAAVATFGNVADRTGGSLPNQSALLGAKAIDLCNRATRSVTPARAMRGVGIPRATFPATPTRRRHSWPPDSWPECRKRSTDRRRVTVRRARPMTPRPRPMTPEPDPRSAAGIRADGARLWFPSARSGAVVGPLPPADLGWVSGIA